MTTHPSKKHIVLLATCLITLAGSTDIQAQRLGRYLEATKPDKNTEETNNKIEKKNTSQYKDRSDSRLESYPEKTRSPRATQPQKHKKRQRFHRTPKRQRHHVSSYGRHRYKRRHHHNYNTILILDDQDIYSDTYTPEPSRPIETLTQDQIDYTNAMLDVYEQREGLFQVSTGLGSALGSSSGINSFHLGLGFTAPPSYDMSGRNVSTWGLGYNYKGYEDAQATLHSHRLFLEGKNTRLYNDFAHSWRVRLGTNVLKSSTTSAGLLFGIHYDLHNLDSLYAFHIGYDGTLYNIGSVDFDTTWESNIESYFRLYFGDMHVDIGGEINIIDLENGDYFHQAFTRVGFRF